MTGGEEGWNQRWRGPLRSGLEIVRDASDDVFDRMGATMFKDPWAARDAYVDVVIGATDLETFLETWASGPLTEDDQVRAADLLELQRNSLSMFTSCGWFFNDIGGIETVQVLRYAARTLDLLEALGQTGPRDAFLALLEQAQSNDPEVGTGADVFAGVYEVRAAS